MKRVLSGIGSVLIAFLLIQPLLLILICVPLWVPVEYCLFRRSPYCKDGWGKYSLFISISPYYRFYNMVRREGFPIEYLPYPYTADGYTRTNTYGLFLYGHTLIEMDLNELGFDSAADQFVIENESDATPLPVYMEEMRGEADELKGPGYCTGVVALISRREVEKLTAEEPPSWCILYDRGRKAEALKAYIEAHSLQ